MTTSPLRSSNEISRVDLGLSVAGRILEATPANIVRAVQAMREGGIIVSPTVTNYCLLCDATNPEAVEKVFAAKKRVKLGPLPVQIADPARIREYVILPEGKRRQAVEAMLPGEICFILPQLYPFCERLTCGLGTIAISSTTHPVFRAVLEEFEGPVAATSANISGQGDIHVSLEKAAYDLGEQVDAYLDDGPTSAGQAAGSRSMNTIVDLTFDVPMMVREGWVPTDEVRRHLPDLVVDTTLYKNLLAERARARTGSGQNG